MVRHLVTAKQKLACSAVVVAFGNIALAKFEDTDGVVRPETMGLIKEARQRRLDQSGHSSARL